MDGITPDCETASGCIIPQLHPLPARAIKIRAMLASLHEVVDPGTILASFDADLDDLELLAVIEAELKEKRDGERRQAPDRG